MPGSALHAAVDRLRLGDPVPLRRFLESDQTAPLHEWEAAWYRAFTIAGGMREYPRIRQGEHVDDFALSHRIFLMTGGPPRVLDNAAALRNGMRLALASAPTRSSHRLRFLGWMNEVLAGRAAGVLARNVVGLARHYTDLPVDAFSGWDEAMRGDVIATGRPLLEWLTRFITDDRRLCELLEQGLASRSEPRRELSETLLRLAS